MPSAPPRRCSRPGCRQFVPCPNPDHQRLPPRQRGYDRTWEKRAAQAKREQGVCQNCGTSGTPDNPLTGDHPIPLAAGGSRDQPIVVLCRRCNSSKGAR